MHSNRSTEGYTTAEHSHGDQSEDIELEAFLEDGHSSDDEGDDNIGRPRGRPARQNRLDGRAAQTYTASEERAVLRKLDRHLVFFLAILYMLSFLDRSSQKPYVF